MQKVPKIPCTGAAQAGLVNIGDRLSSEGSLAGVIKKINAAGLPPKEPGWGPEIEALQKPEFSGRVGAS